MEVSSVPARLRSLPSYALTRAAASAAHLVADRVLEMGVSKAAFGMLATIEEFGPQSQADLGRRMGMNRKNVSEESAGLERAGLVRRGPDPDDSRRNRLEITSEGRELLARLDVSFQEVQDALLSPLTARERAELARMLELIAGSAGGWAKPF